MRISVVLFLLCTVGVFGKHVEQEDDSHLLQEDDIIRIHNRAVNIKDENEDLPEEGDETIYVQNEAKERLHKLSNPIEIEDEEEDSFIVPEEAMERMHNQVNNFDIENNGLPDNDEDFYPVKEFSMERIDELPIEPDSEENALTRQSVISGSLCGCGSMERCVTVFECVTPGCNFTYECLGETDADPCGKCACQRNQACYRINSENADGNSTCPSIIGTCLKLTDATIKPGKCPKVPSVKEQRRRPWWWFGRSLGLETRYGYRRSCQNDRQCSGDKKCCQLEGITNQRCMSPVKDGDKPGECPTSASGCSRRSECTEDSDCPSKLKCCTCDGSQKCVTPVAPAASGL